MCAVRNMRLVSAMENVAPPTVITSTLASMGAIMERSGNGLVKSGNTAITDQEHGDGLVAGQGEHTAARTNSRRQREFVQEEDQLALADRITRTIAHEMRNPLTNLHLALEVLQDDLTTDRGVVQPYLDMMHRNVERIGQLITDMLGAARKRQVVLVPCRVNDLVMDAMARVTDRLDLRHIVGEVELLENSPTVLADPELINLAITNLAVNAAEAMESGKGVLRLRVRSTPQGTVIDVSDNGKGIAPENITKLFDPFYSDRPGGMGLGLTTARSVLLAQNVLLDVESTVGEGSTFTLHFPVAERLALG